MDTEDQVIALAQSIHQQIVMAKVMPIGNMTNMTDAERAMIGVWFQSLQP
ncbi:hypothetical protein [Leucothrix pacifica]|nr:hypothetical protein [Leucothrix pacifica]